MIQVLAGAEEPQFPVSWMMRLQATYALLSKTVLRARVKALRLSLKGWGQEEQANR